MPMLSLLFDHKWTLYSSQVKNCQTWANVIISRLFGSIIVKPFHRTQTRFLFLVFFYERQKYQTISRFLFHFWRLHPFCVKNRAKGKIEDYKSSHFEVSVFGQYSIDCNIVRTVLDLIKKIISNKEKKDRKISKFRWIIIFVVSFSY